MSDKRLHYLFHRYFEKTATAEERAELMALLGKSENDEETRTLLEEAWEKLQLDEKLFSEGQSQAMLHRLLGAAGAKGLSDKGTEETVRRADEGVKRGLNEEAYEGEKGGMNQEVYGGVKGAIEMSEQENLRVPVITMRRGMVAAAVLLLLGVGMWFFRRPSTQQGPVASSGEIKKKGVIDVPAPNGNNAILTLEDGSTVVLDSARNGALTQQGGAQVSKSNAGKLVYNALGHAPEKTVYNTVSTRRGGQFQIVLPDGSKVWLNTVSSLRFPTSFTGTERVVELTGEAYFEVAKNAAMPFRVHVRTAEDKGMDVGVLGTQFNVMAYDNEAEVRTTLLEGAVKVVKGEKSRVLAPGQQAKLDKLGGLTLEENADVELATAWKNGVTSFKSADIRSIMRQVERWYDIDVVYEGNVPDRTFSGGISRDANLSELIRLLEVNKIHFKVEGRKLTVMP